jgi:hypothetical protein
MSLPSLYQIRQDHLNLINLIEDNGGEVDAEVLSMLELTETNFNEKAISYSNVVKVFENDESIIDAEIKRLQEMKKRKAKAKEAFENKLTEAMQQFGIDKIETPTRKLSFRKSEAIEVENVDIIPSRYFNEKTTYTIDKDRVKLAIKEGIEIPGVQLVTKQNLQIK